ncbi:ATP-binding protein [Wolinella succinogenes]|uniref:ATP-binding protein n=1 Tax=Wolinella succinogenes TaxID=844 RepID=UPI0024094F6E|nr:ATP-binding protein [Wolinella succinogenes]
MSLFGEAKQLFAESASTNDFISLDANIRIKEKLKEHILHKPFQILLLTGAPGVGKTYVAENLTEELGSSKVYFQKFPFATTVSFLSAVHSHFLPHVSLPEPCHRESLLASFKEHLAGSYIPAIIVDEIQLYKDEELEIIRMLSDTRLFRFIFIIHKLERQNLLAQSYFVSRTWGSLELEGLTPLESKLFITQKLTQNGLKESLPWLKNRQYSLLYKLSEGNLRVLCKLCYTMFEICEHYESHAPSLLANDTVPLRFIEMAALDLGVLHE